MGRRIPRERDNLNEDSCGMTGKTLQGLTLGVVIRSQSEKKRGNSRAAKFYGLRDEGESHKE